MPHNYTRRESQCTHIWKDGWGQHECQRDAGHEKDEKYPRCMCDCDDMVTHPEQPRPNPPSTQSGTAFGVFPKESP